MTNATRTTRFRFWLWLIRVVGVIVPRRLRADWRQEWEAELRHREALLAEWDRLDWKNRLDLLRRSTSAFWDALWLQPKRWEDEMFQDMRFGLRMLLKHPGFTFIAVLTLALGIGANTAIFSVVNAVLIRPLPYPEPDRLVILDEVPPGGGQFAIAPGNFVDWRDQSGSFVGMAAFGRMSFNLTGHGEAERLPGLRLSANSFALLGIKPALGRDFLPEEDQPDYNRVVILSYGLWQRRFGGEPDLVGKMLTLDGNSYTVIGIMPRDFRFFEGIEVWTPLALTPRERASHDKHDFNAFARLKPNVSLEHARAEMSAIAGRLAAQYPISNDDWGIRLTPLRDEVVGPIQPVLLALSCAVAFVLLIACANVGNLLLARSAVRQREVAIRAALGASRRRVIRQLLTESLLLGIAGGVIGLLLAVWGVNFLRVLTPDSLGVETVAIDGRALGFTAIVSLLTSLLFGLAPAVQAANPNLSESLKEGGRSGVEGRGRNRTRSLLVIAEIAMSLALLISAGLVIKSFIRLLQVDPGFQSKGLLTMQVSLPNAKYPERSSRAVFFQQLTEKIAALPGVASAGAASTLPFRIDEVQEFIIGGRPPITPGKEPSANYYAVSADYFRAMEIPLLKGRAFTGRDTKDAPRVAIISESLTRRYFPDEDPIGKRMDISKGGFGTWREIVGVVGDVKHYGLDSQTTVQIYEPYLQVTYPAMSLVVRTTGDPREIAAAIRGQVAAMDNDQPVANIRTMDVIVSGSVARQRFSALLLALFAGVALILAAVGIYGVMSYYVAQRTHEIGIRMALGAERCDLLRLVVGKGMLLALIGVMIGLAAAFTLTRLMSGLLFEVEATDRVTFAATAVLLTSVALLACWIPARRATKVDPIVALRSE
jgi:putative ABC transport system permease protein